jgi:hypothetical protein
MRFFVLILFLLNQTIYAYNNGIDEVYTFIGVQGGYSKYDKKDAPTIGITYGKQNAMWRTSIHYNYASISDNTYHSAIIQVDRGVLTELFKEYPFKPYFGISLGAMQYRNGGESDNGYLFGGNFGFNYVLNHMLDIDLGYRYMVTSKLDHLKDRGDILLSLHYYFD